VWARVQHLERKVFWPDEVFTALRVSGHTLAEFRELFDDRVHSLAEVAAYQERDPASGVGAVVASFAAEEPQHAPLFYVADRLAIDLFGSSIAAYRSVSVLAGLLSIGCAFALGRLAFGSRTGGFVLATLVAVSPYHVHFSRQAREYELISTMTLGASALLLWALARSTPLRWLAYASALALGLYTDPLFAAVLAAHGITAVATKRGRAALRFFVAAVAGALIVFSPWALVLLRERASAHAQLDWLAGTYPLKFFAEKWLFNAGTVAFDAELRDLRLAVVVVAFALVVLVAAVRALRAALSPANEPVAVLGLSLLMVPVLLFGAYDIVERAHYTTVARYFAESAVGIELIVAGWIAAWLATRGPRSVAGLALLAILALAGIASDLTSAGAVNWWDNNTQIDYAAVARAAGAQPSLAVSDAAAALVLSHYLPSDARLVLVRDPARSAEQVGRLAGSVFLVAPSLELLTASSAAGLRFDNVSPPNPSLMANFRAGLRREQATAGAALDPQSAANALWILRRSPGQAAGAPKATSPPSSK